VSPYSLGEQLENSRDYGDVFDVVKKAVKQSIGRERAGLMLYLGNLPLQVGAFHGVGSNGIVVNRKLLSSISFETIAELNSYVFTLLLHEYLHSLGYMDEGNVRRLVYEISRENFGEDHPAARFARDPPLPRIPPSELQPGTEEPELEIIRDFDRSSTSYIN